MTHRGPFQPLLFYSVIIMDIANATIFLLIFLSRILKPDKVLRKFR